VLDAHLQQDPDAKVACGKTVSAYICVNFKTLFFTYYLLFSKVYVLYNKVMALKAIQRS